MVIVRALLNIGLISPWAPNFDMKPLASQVAFHDPMLTKGADLFYKKGCQCCHQIDGHGGLTGPSLSRIDRTWTRNRLEIQIVNGRQNMPAYGSILSKEELQTLVAFLETRQ